MAAVWYIADASASTENVNENRLTSLASCSELAEARSTMNANI